MRCITSRSPVTIYHGGAYILLAKITYVVKTRNIVLARPFFLPFFLFFFLFRSSYFVEIEGPYYAFHLIVGTALQVTLWDNKLGSMCALLGALQHGALIAMPSSRLMTRQRRQIDRFDSGAQVTEH